MHKAIAFFFVCAGLLTLALLLPCPAAAVWPSDPTVNVPLCTATGEQKDPTVVSDGAGGAIVTWQDYRSGSNNDIYAQRISAGGVIQWTANGVALCTATGNQYSPTIVSDGAGGAIVSWEDYRSGTSDIYARRISAAGVVQWAANGVALCTATGNQYSPTITSDGAGGAIVTWEDARSGTNMDIYARRISAAGAVQWTANGVALCTATGNQNAPTIVSVGASGAIVAWRDNRGGLGDIYAQGISAAGTPQWTADGVAVTSAVDFQYEPTLVSDGTGGAIVTWVDDRSGVTSDIYAQRMLTSGVVQWAANGVALCTATGDQEFPTIASDGAGGAIVTWQDMRSGNYDIYAQRISAGGSVQWAANGVALCAATDDQLYPTIVSDGASGAIVTWQDGRSVEDWDIYGRRILAAGTLPLGAADGVALCTDMSDQFTPTIASDGRGGAIVTWYEERQADNDIYAQKIGPEPAIQSVLDLPADQGGRVRIKWAASWLESPALGISMYGIWRRVEESTALKAIAATAKLAASADGSAEAQLGTFRTTMTGTNTLYWEGVGTVVTHGDPTYTFTTFTFQDSTATSNPYSVFMVDYQATLLPEYWSSAPDSGYSVDNLAPPTPTPFTGQYASGIATLHWGLSTAPDFSTFMLYRGSSAGFVPGPGSLVAARRDTGYVDNPGAAFYYKLSAVDIHGNESPHAFLLPSGTVDVPEIGPLAFMLEGVRPNPSRGEGLTVAFTLPTTATARLELLDVSGRRVVEREVGSLGAGTHTLDLGVGQRLAPGLYLVRLTQGANTRTTRVAVLQ